MICFSDGFERKPEALSNAPKPEARAQNKTQNLEIQNIENK